MADPIPILNGQQPLTTINGEKTFTEAELLNYLMNRPDVETFVQAGGGQINTDATNDNKGLYGQNINTNSLLPGQSGSPNDSDSTNARPNQSGTPSYNMNNILDYYQNAAQNVNFNSLRQQQYGKYQMGQAIGVLYIPRLDRSIPIIYGTSENDLRYGVGFHRSTKLPGQSNQILLAGHRDTVFRDFGKLRIGDEFHVKMATGTYIYTIFGSQIVDWDDPTVIQSTYPNEILTVSTCYPFNYLGPAPERYVLYAK